MLFILFGSIIVLLLFFSFGLNSIVFFSLVLIERNYGKFDDVVFLVDENLVVTKLLELLYNDKYLDNKLIEFFRGLVIKKKVKYK